MGGPGICFFGSSFQNGVSRRR